MVVCSCELLDILKMYMYNLFVVLFHLLCVDSGGSNISKENQGVAWGSLDKTDGSGGQNTRVECFIRSDHDENRGFPMQGNNVHVFH